MLVILYKATESQIIPVMLPGKKGTYRTKIVKVLYSILRALILSLDWRNDRML